MRWRRRTAVSWASMRLVAAFSRHLSPICVLMRLALCALVLVLLVLNTQTASQVREQPGVAHLPAPAVLHYTDLHPHALQTQEPDPEQVLPLPDAPSTAPRELKLGTSSMIAC